MVQVSGSTLKPGTGLKFTGPKFEKLRTGPVLMETTQNRPVRSGSVPLHTPTFHLQKFIYSLYEHTWIKRGRDEVFDNTSQPRLNLAINQSNFKCILLILQSNSRNILSFRNFMRNPSKKEGHHDSSNGPTNSLIDKCH